MRANEKYKPYTIRDKVPGLMARWRIVSVIINITNKDIIFGRDNTYI